MADAPAAQFFTWGALGTLAGATGGTFAVTNALSVAFGFSPKWLGLAVAEAICLSTVIFFGQLRREWLIAILNGCLVFLSAAGATGATNSTVNAVKVALQPPVYDATALLLKPWI